MQDVFQDQRGFRRTFFLAFDWVECFPLLEAGLMKIEMRIKTILNYQYRFSSKRVPQFRCMLRGLATSAASGCSSSRMRLYSQELRVTVRAMTWMEQRAVNGWHDQSRPQTGFLRSTLPGSIILATIALVGEKFYKKQNSISRIQPKNKRGKLRSPTQLQLQFECSERWNVTITWIM